MNDATIETVTGHTFTFTVVDGGRDSAADPWPIGAAAVDGYWQPRFEQAWDAVHLWHEVAGWACEQADRSGEYAADDVLTIRIFDADGQCVLSDVARVYPD